MGGNFRISTQYLQEDLVKTLQVFPYTYESMELKRLLVEDSSIIFYMFGECILYDI